MVRRTATGSRITMPSSTVPTTDRVSSPLPRSALHDQAPPGLINYGNTCFVNAVMQCLAASALFRVPPLHALGVLSPALQQVYEDTREMLTALRGGSTSASRTMFNLLQSLADLPDALVRVGSQPQRDAEAFLLQLVGVLDSVYCKTQQARRRLHAQGAAAATPVDVDGDGASSAAAGAEHDPLAGFRSVWEYRSTCETCRKQSSKRDMQLSLNVGLPADEEVGVEVGMGGRGRPLVADGDGDLDMDVADASAGSGGGGSGGGAAAATAATAAAAAVAGPVPPRPPPPLDLRFCIAQQTRSRAADVFCDCSTGRVSVQHTAAVIDAPATLLVVLKRFTYDVQLGAPVKRRDYVNVPLMGLDLAEFFTHVPDEPAAKRRSTKRKAADVVPILYNLRAVCCHVGRGGCNSGHYIAYVRSVVGAWFECNDTRIMAVPAATVQQRIATDAYILVYDRVSAP